MAAYLTPWLPFLVYSTSRDQAATHRTASNTGREAHAYLQFIVDYYDCLPHVRSEAYQICRLESASLVEGLRAR